METTEYIVRKGSRSNSVQLQQELRRKVEWWLVEGGDILTNVTRQRGEEKRRGW